MSTIERWVIGIFSIISITLLIGIIFPIVFIDSGLSELQCEEQVFGRFMITQTKQALDGTFEGVFITQYRIYSIHGLPDRRDDKCAYEPFQITGQFSGRVKLYTIFGLPYGEVLIGCDGWEKMDRYYW
jgi:hypothetical protein